MAEAITFPMMATAGQTYEFGGTTYEYNADRNRWEAQAAGGGSITVSQTRPDPMAGSPGDLWWYCGDTGEDPALFTLLADASMQQQWVQSSPGIAFEGSLSVQDSTVQEGTNINVLNFGDNLAVSVSGSTATIDGPAGGGGLGGNGTAPTSVGSGSSVTVTNPGLYYFRGNRSGTGTVGTATVSGSTITGMIWGLSNFSSGPSFGVGVITASGGNMQVGVSRSTSSAPSSSFGGWVETSGRTVFGGTNVTVAVYEVG